jgi:hypothetical protein
VPTKKYATQRDLGLFSQLLSLVWNR